MKFRYSVFDLEFISFVLINLLYVFWLPLISLILTFIFLTIASVEYVELNDKPANIEYIADYIKLFILALLPLLHICLKNFYLYFLAKKILKKGAFKYRKLIKKINDNTKIKRNILTTAFIADVIIILIATGWAMLDGKHESPILVVSSFALAHFIFGGFFLPYFTLFKLLNVRRKRVI